MMNRRKFLGAAVTLPFALRAMARDVGKRAPRWVFLGTDKGKGIYRAPWNATTGELGKIELAAGADRPDFFAMHPRLPVMYSVNSVVDGKGGVSSFRLDAAGGKLTLLNKVSSHGDGPCYVSVTRDGRTAFVANYQGGSFAAYQIDGAGALVDAGAFDCRQQPACGPLGPVHDRQDAPHLHCAVLSPHNDFVLVCDLADDAIEIFQIVGMRHFQSIPTRVSARTGSGPRHLAFHPNGRWVYCIHELDATVDLYDWRVGEGKPELTLREASVVSTLAPGISLIGNTGCEIFVSDDGRFVYTCSRGVDEILVYRVGQQGLLTAQQRVSCRGKVPRYIALDPSRKWLVSCNQGAGPNPVGNVTVFANDAATGRLNETPKTFAAETPMFVEWV